MTTWKLYRRKKSLPFSYENRDFECVSTGTTPNGFLEEIWADKEEEFVWKIFIEKGYYSYLVAKRGEFDDEKRAYEIIRDNSNTLEQVKHVLKKLL